MFNSGNNRHICLDLYECSQVAGREWLQLVAVLSLDYLCMRFHTSSSLRRLNFYVIHRILFFNIRLRNIIQVLYISYIRIWSIKEKVTVVYHKKTYLCYLCVYIGFPFLYALCIMYVRRTFRFVQPHYTSQTLYDGLRVNFIWVVYT